MFLVCLFFKLILYERSNTIALTWTEIKHKTRHCQGENSSFFIHIMYYEIFISSKIGYLLMKKKMNQQHEKY